MELHIDRNCYKCKLNWKKKEAEEVTFRDGDRVWLHDVEREWGNHDRITLKYKIEPTDKVAEAQKIERVVGHYISPTWFAGNKLSYVTYVGWGRPESDLDRDKLLRLEPTKVVVTSYDYPNTLYK
jgi:hypothetical protein